MVGSTLIDTENGYYGLNSIIMCAKVIIKKFKCLFILVVKMGTTPHAEESGAEVWASDFNQLTVDAMNADKDDLERVRDETIGNLIFPPVNRLGEGVQKGVE